MRTSPRLIAASLLSAGIVGLGYFAWSREARIDDLVERERMELERSRPITADSRRAAELLDGLDTLLADCQGKEDALGAPWAWHPAFDNGLRTALEPLAPFFDEADVVLGSPAVTHSLAGGLRLDRYTSMMWSRSRTNLLCAKAILEARDGHTEEAVRRLEQALDLARVDFDPSGFELVLNSMSNRIVLEAVRCVLAEKRTDPVVIERLLAPRLTAIASSTDLSECLRGDALATFSADWERSDQRPDPVEVCMARGAAADRLVSLRSGSLVIPSAKATWPHAVADLDAFFAELVARDAGMQRRRFALALAALTAAAIRSRGEDWAASLASMDDLQSDDGTGAFSWIVEDGEARLMALTAPESGTIEAWTLR